jgi:hypothetical protein
MLNWSSSAAASGIQLSTGRLDGCWTLMAQAHWPGNHGHTQPPAAPTTFLRPKGGNVVVALLI